jgi:hypothetical protein
MSGPDEKEKLLRIARPFVEDQLTDDAFDGIKKAVATEYNIHPDSIGGEILDHTSLRLDLPDHSVTLQFKVDF